MIHIKILRGLDLDEDEASEMYLTLTLAGLSKTSRVTKKFTPLAELTQSQRSLTEGWVWNEELDLVLPPAPTPNLDYTAFAAASADIILPPAPQEHEIEVELFNASKQFRSQGQVRIPISRLSSDQPVQQWYSLSTSKGSILLNLTLVSTPVDVPSSVTTPEAAAPLTPQAKTPETTKLPTTAPKSDVNNMPMGLADYFVVAGCAKETCRQERLAMLSRRRRNQKLAANGGGNQEVDSDELSQATYSGVDGVTLSPMLLERYPEQDRAEIEFPTKCEMFLLPDGVEILVNPKEIPEQRNFTFILVNNNVRLFGFCLEVWDIVPSNDLLDMDVLVVPTVYCYLTRLPLSHLDFKWILDRTLHAKLESGFFPRIVQRVLLEIPTPLPGLFSVEFDLFGRRKIALPDFATSLPPLLYPDLCSHLLGWFSIDDVIRLWIAALTEQKILIHSNNRETLGMLSESLVQLMYPFKWENGFIPVLPTSLMQIFDAPIPVILGLRTDALKLIPASAQMSEVFIQIDADACTITFPEDTGDKLPTELHVRLFRMIRQAQLREHNAERRDQLIRFAFVECLASLLQGYRECFFSLSSGADGGTVFNKAQFFIHQTAQRAQLSSTLAQLFSPAGTAAVAQEGGNNRFTEDSSFLNHFFETTAFERFKVSQHDPENELFHQVYRTRRARERERDQRLGSLAGLQSDATLPLVRVWNARMARWDTKSQDPIVPVSVVAGEEEMVNLTCAALVKVGERVLCGAFGEGTVLEVQPDSDICKVSLQANATGYFHLSAISAVEQQRETETVDFRSTFAPIVANSCPKPAFKKAFAHYKRMVGAVATENVVRKTVNTKTPLENKVERIVIRTITNIFQDKAVNETDIRDCHTYLSDLFARNTLMQVLKSQHSDLTWLATPGRGRRLGDQAFASLCELVDSLLRSCAQCEDYSNGRTVLDVSPYFYCGEETLQTKLKGHVLWTKLMFWEYAFAENLVALNVATAAAATAATTPPRTTAAAGGGLNSSTFIEDSTLQQQQLAPRSLQQLQEAALQNASKLPLFEQLSVFVHNMLNLDVPEDMARAFVDRVATVFPLDPDYKTTLNMLITNICKSMSSYEEEQEVDLIESSPAQPHSPSRLQRRSSSAHAASTRKRSGIDAMFSRLGVTWRKSAAAPGTAPLPPTASGKQGGGTRRDSLNNT